MEQVGRWNTFVSVFPMKYSLELDELPDEPPEEPPDDPEPEPLLDPEPEPVVSLPPPGRFSVAPSVEKTIFPF